MQQISFHVGSSVDVGTPKKMKKIQDSNPPN
jgi:hypothetical protein